MNTESSDHFWKKVAWIFLPSVLFFSLVFILCYWYMSRTTMATTLAYEKNIVNLYNQHLHADLFSIFSDLKFIASQNHLQLYIDGDLTARKELESNYLSFVQVKGLYDQVRFLDKTGMERIRVNYNSGAPKIVPENRLQNKFSRYYFADTFALNSGEIFISPLDLNIEGGKIEQPIKPMIRFGLPILNAGGKKQGVLLFNYLGSRIFNAFDHSAPQALGDGMLLNKDGYWLKGPTAEDEWGFMYPDKQDRKFQSRFTKEWQQINKAESGQFTTDNGLFTFTTVRPLELNMKPLTFSRGAEDSASGHQINRNYFWKVVSLTSPEVIAQQLRTPRQVLLSTFIVIAGLLFALSVAKTRSLILKEQSEKSHRAKNRVLEAEQKKLKSALREIRENHQELEKTYHDLKYAQTQLLQAEKMQSVGRLAAGMAHEINTPIQFVGDNTQFILESMEQLEKVMVAHNLVLEAAAKGVIAPDLLQEAKAIEEEIDLDYLRTEIPLAIRQSQEGIERVAGIVRAMKEFSHPGSDEKTSIDLNKAIENAAIVSRHEWKYNSELELDLDLELSQVSCLGGEINQAILNLIINASHAVNHLTNTESSQKGLIRIITRSQDDYVIIRVSDNGIGIPGDILSKIFDPFFTTKKVGQGTGQGLAIVYSTIVDKHGGTIKVESEVGKGTTFIIRLPVEERDLKTI